MVGVGYSLCMNLRNDDSTQLTIFSIRGFTALGSFISLGVVVLILAPAPMSSGDLEYERLSYAADLVVAVTFGLSILFRLAPLNSNLIFSAGIYVTIAAICIHFLLQRRRSRHVILWYTVTLLLTGTTWFICGAWFGELELVELSPSVIGEFSSPKHIVYTRVTLVKNLTYTVNIFLADSLLVRSPPTAFLRHGL